MLRKNTTKAFLKVWILAFSSEGQSSGEKLLSQLEKLTILGGSLRYTLEFTCIHYNLRWP